MLLEQPGVLFSVEEEGNGFVRALCVLCSQHPVQVYALLTCRAFCVVMSPTIVRTPLTALMGTRSMPMIRLLIGMVF